eukprot:COSAG04_NODE_3708_length_2592_cov_1.251103_3_plen_276_part_00
MQLFGCQLKSGAVPANENFAFNPSSGQIHSFINADSCLVASAGHTGGIVYTTDELGEDWCIACGSDSTECDSRPGSVAAVPCADLQRYTHGRSWSVDGGGTSLQLYVDGSKEASLGFVNPGATSSGPRPHVAYTWVGNAQPATRWNWPAFNSSGGGHMKPATPTNISDNDNVNGPLQTVDASERCLTLGLGGHHEIWSAPMSGGRVAVALANRDGNRANASMTVQWGVLGLPADAKMSVLDVWRNRTTAVSQGSWTDPAVPGHGVTLLILTPVQE